MSVFSDSTTNQSAENNTSNEGNQSYIAKLVAAKGETWKDPEIIAKGKLEADEYITNLERQLEEMKQDFEKTKTQQDYAKTLLETLNQSKPLETSSSQGESKETTGTQTENTTLDPSKLEELIAQTLDKRTAAQIAADNVRKVDEHMVATYGTEAANAVKAKAQELGLSAEYMRSIAEQSPHAFFSLIGAPKPTESASPPKGSVNSEAVLQTGERTYDFYRNLRKTDPVKYHSKEVQKQMFEDAKKAALAGKPFTPT